MREICANEIDVVDGGIIFVPALIAGFKAGLAIVGSMQLGNVILVTAGAGAVAGAAAALAD